MKRFFVLLSLCFAVLLASNSQAVPQGKHPGYQTELIAATDICTPQVYSFAVRPDVANIDIQSTNLLISAGYAEIKNPIRYGGLLFFKLNSWHTNLLTNSPFY